MDEKIYRYWWLHDGAWYQNVAKTFGFEAANELNQQCLRYMAQRTMRDYVKEHHIDTHFRTIEDLTKHLMKATLTMLPEEWCKTRVEILAPDCFDVVLYENFAVDSVRRAGTLDSYACPGLMMRQGWFAGLGIAYTDEEIECMIRGDKVCRFRAHVDLPALQEK
jgi:hypothetical protein